MALRLPAASCWILLLLCVACSRQPEATNKTQPLQRPELARAASDVRNPAREWIARNRRHGWKLFESVTTADALLLLEQQQWHTEAETFMTGNTPHFPNHVSPATGGAQTPRYLMLFNPIERVGVDGPTYPVYEATFYNDGAYHHVRNEQLWRDGRAEELRNDKRREITEFPKGAMVVKTFWRPVPKTGAVERKAYVGIWEWRKQHAEDTADAIDEGAWKTTSGPDHVCVVSEIPADGCRIAGDTFFTARAANLSGQTCISGKCPAQVETDQTMILIGLHIASKDQPDWFWATFWWKGVGRTDGEEWTCDNADRHSSLETGVRSNYSMDVGTSVRLPKPAILEKYLAICGTPGDIRNMNNPDGLDAEYYATYNPFVEGVKSLGRKSSCLDCHSRATTYKSQDPFDIPPVADINHFYPGLRDFENHVRTDYLWTVKRYIGFTEQSSYATNGQPR